MRIHQCMLMTPEVDHCAGSLRSWLIPLRSRSHKGSDAQESTVRSGYHTARAPSVRRTESTPPTDGVQVTVCGRACTILHATQSMQAANAVREVSSSLPPRGDSPFSVTLSRGRSHLAGVTPVSVRITLCLGTVTPEHLGKPLAARGV